MIACKAAGVCVVFGDPHYRTFDGRTYTFQGACRYLLAAVGSRWCGPLTAADHGDIALRSNIAGTFSVRVTNMARSPGNYYTWTRTVSITLQGDTRIDLLQHLRVRVNRKPVRLPYTDPVGGRYSIQQQTFTSSSYDVIKLKSSLGVEVVWDGNSYLELSVPVIYRGAVCGLCGNYNGRESDDVLGRDGRRYLDVEEFGRTWRLDGHRPDLSCVRLKFRSTAAERHQHRQHRPVRRRSAASRGSKSGGPGACNNGPTLNDIQRHCAAVLKSARFRRCHARVDVTHYYRSCVMDSCQCPAGKQCSCQVITAYIRACQRAGVRSVSSNVTSLCSNC